MQLKATRSLARSRALSLSLALSLSAAALLACAPAPALAQPRPAPARRPAASRPAPPPAAPAVSPRSLVFVLTTGLEDLQRMSSAFRHAGMAAKERKLREVVVLVYGRGIYALDRRNQVRPASLPATIRDAMAAGVRVLVCANSLAKAGLTPADLDPAPSQVVPNAMSTLVDYVARDAAIVSY